MMSRPPEPAAIQDWASAERNARNWMRYLGFSDAELTTGGSDGGVDVESTSGLAQVKYQAAIVARSELQKLVGSRMSAHHKKLLFFTGSAYSSKATEYAEVMDIALFTYDVFGRIEAINGPAHLLFDGLAPRADRKAVEAPDFTNELGAAPSPPSVTRTDETLIRMAETLLADVSRRDRDAVVDAVLLGKLAEAAERYRSAAQIPAFSAKTRIERLVREAASSDGDSSPR